MNVGATYNDNMQLQVCTADNGIGCSDCGSGTITPGTWWAGNTCDITGRFVRIERALTDQNWHFCRVKVSGEQLSTGADSSGASSIGIETDDSEGDEPVALYILIGFGLALVVISGVVFMLCRMKIQAAANVENLRNDVPLDDVATAIPVE